MTISPFSLLLLRRLRKLALLPPATPQFRHHLSTAAAAPLPDSSHDSKPPNLSSRLAFVFDQIDAIDRDRSAKDAALQRIRAWRQTNPPPPPTPPPPLSAPEAPEAGAPKKEVELVHPWPEWIELMERLARQNYFDPRRVDEDRIAQNIPIDLSGIKDETGFDFVRDWTTVRTACMNFGRDRFDILRSLSRNDIQILVGHGCPSMDSKVVFSAKLLRKYVHLDEGDVCSGCSLRNSCGRGYILTHKEDEARTLDVMRVLLTFGFDHVIGSVENKILMKMKSVKAVVRKLLHEVVKLSSVPIDPNLPPPVIKKPPPKVKQPPPPPKKRVGRDDVEMKKGDWLCSKCNFMNFAKNTVCLQCDAKRPKRQLLPGEWECPQCNFLNYRRNMACFHCDHKRPPDEFTENEMQAREYGPRTRSERVARMTDVSNAWNFDFDDNESDGADVAAFEFADSSRMSDFDGVSHGGAARNFEGEISETRKMPRTHERKSTLRADRTGFDDFDDEEDDDVESYELDMPKNNQVHEVHRRNFSEVDKTSESEDFEDFDRHINSDRGDEDTELNSDSDGDTGFKSRQRKGRQRNFASDGVFHDSESDDEGHRHSHGRKTRENVGVFGSSRSREFRSGDRVSNRRDSFQSSTGNSPSGGSRRFERGSPSRGSRTFERGSRGGASGGWRENDKFQRYDRQDDRVGSQHRKREKSNQFNDRSSGFRRNEGGSRDGYGGRTDFSPRTFENKQRGRLDRSSNRPRSFDDSNSDDRPRRRIIER